MLGIRKQFRQLKGGIFKTPTGRIRFASKFWRRAYRSTDGRTTLRRVRSPDKITMGLKDQYRREISFTRRLEDRMAQNRGAKSGRRERQDRSVAKRYR